MDGCSHCLLKIRRISTIFSYPWPKALVSLWKLQGFMQEWLGRSSSRKLLFFYIPTVAVKANIHYLAHSQSMLLHLIMQTLVDMHEKYGPVFRLHMPLVKRPFVYSNFVPNAIHNRHLDSLRPTKTLSPGSLMGIPLGDRHSKNRHHLSKIKSNTNFKQMLKDVDIVSKDLVQEMLKGEAASLKSMLLEWSLDAMFLYLYATHPDTSEKKQAIIAAVDMFTCEISHRTSEPMWMWFSSFSRVREWTTGFSYLLNLADEFYGKSASPLPNFMKAHGLEKWEAIDELTIFLAASFESTAHTVAQCLIMLSKDSERQDEAAKEAKKVLAEVGSGPILKEHTDQCMYIQHCVFQALRLHATVPFSARKMEHDYSIKDLNGMSATFIPAKSYLTYFKTAIGDNESIFPDAKVFKPERYEGMKSRTEKHMKFLPFGTGPLQCWGQVLAEMQMIQLLIRLLGNLDFSHTDIDSKSISIASVSVAAPGVDKVHFMPREQKE